MTRHLTFPLVAALAAPLALASPTFAQQGDDLFEGANADSKSQPRQSQGQARDTARTVEIKRSSVWGFSNEVRRYLSDAYKDMYSKPEEAAEDMGIAVSMVEILSAAAEPGQARQALQQAADELSRLEQRVTNRQALNPEKDLAPVFARTAFALAKAQTLDARDGLERQEASAFGYSLESAANNLHQALIYQHAEEVPESVSRAIYNADRLGDQVEAMLHPTTQQGGHYTVSLPEEKSDSEGRNLLQQQGDADTPSNRIASAAPRVLSELEEAVSQVEGMMEGQPRQASTD